MKLLAIVFVFWSQPAQAQELKCLDPSAPSEELVSLRDRLIEVSGYERREFLRSCYSATKIPRCLSPIRDSVEQDLAVSTNYDKSVVQEPKRQPPPELLESLDQDDWSFRLRDDTEAVAQAKGWPFVRYKSRHSGGFDQETPSLLMIRVPGDTLDPPVNYDRYLNIALPSDRGEDALNPTPQAPFPSLMDYQSERRRQINLPRVFTIVTHERSDDGSRPKVYFQMFRRQGSYGNPRFSPEPNQDVNRCVTCHPSGLRAISPLGYHVRAGERQMDPAEWLKVYEMNQSMEVNSKTGEKYKAPDWRGVIFSNGEERKFLVPAGLGPIYGPFTPLSQSTTVGSRGRPITENPTRTRRFIVGEDGSSGCAYSQTSWNLTDIFGRAPGRNNIYTMTRQRPVRWDKVRDAMKCSECHDHDARGGFSRLTDFSQIAFKVLVDQAMPPNAHKDPMEQVDPVTGQRDPNKPVVDNLTGDERIALVNCLRSEFQQYELNEIDRWLKRVSCDKP